LPMARRYVVLLKENRLNLLECDQEEVFPTAHMMEAGICGVFENRKDAKEFLDRLRQDPHCSATLQVLN